MNARPYGPLAVTAPGRLAVCPKVPTLVESGVDGMAWKALTRYLDDGDAPIDNNLVEDQMRPWAIGRSNWLFAGSLRERRACGRHHESDQVGGTERAQSVCLSEGRAHAVADAEKQPDR